MPTSHDRLIAIGVDTHADVHVAAAVDQLGRTLATTLIPTTAAGYAELLTWAHQVGAPQCFGVEGTGAWGAGLARFLADHGQQVLDVNRPDRAARRRNGKSDTLDAEAAARTALAGVDTAIPKVQTGRVEMIRALRVARRSAIKARVQAGNQLHALLARAPEELREQFRDLATPELVTAVARLRPGTPATVVAATKFAMRELAQRWQALQAEIDRLNQALWPLLRAVAPSLLALPGVGPETAAILLEAAGDNPAAAHQRGGVRAPVRRRAAASLLPAARCAIGSTLAGTAPPTACCGASCSSA